MRIEAFPQTIIDKLNKLGCEKESTCFSSKLENLLKMDKVTLKEQYHGGKKVSGEICNPSVYSLTTFRLLLVPF